MVENPADFGCRKVSVNDKPGFFCDLVGHPFFFESIAIGSGTTVLPDNRIVEGLARASIPNDSGFSLVGDANGSHLVGTNRFLKQGLH